MIDTSRPRAIARTIAVWAAAAILASCGGGEGKGSAQTQETQATCPRFFVGGTPPKVDNEKLASGTRTLCRRSFAVLHSGIVRQPIWSAELLTEAAIRQGQAVPRVDAFHPDPELKAEERAELSDYARTGYDRGHLTPDADMPSAEAAHQAMALSNIAPQRPGLNRGAWAELEKAVRRQARGGPIYVVTGTLFESSRLDTTRKDRRLAIPTHFFKAVYAEDRGATVMVATNETRPRWTPLSVEQFTKVYRIDPFPSLDPKFRNVNATLDGSLAQLSGATGAKGATTPGAGGTGTGASGTGTTGTPAGGRMVKSPLSGQYMTEEAFRQSYGREPRPEEYTQ